MDIQGKIDIICRQTNYNNEKAKEQLEKNNNNHIEVIQKYLGVKNKKKDETVKVSFTNTRYSIMRNRLNIIEKLD